MSTTFFQTKLHSQSPCFANDVKHTLTIFDCLETADSPLNLVHVNYSFTIRVKWHPRLSERNQIFFIHACVHLFSKSLAISMIMNYMACPPYQSQSQWINCYYRKKDNVQYQNQSDLSNGLTSLYNAAGTK